MSKIDMILGRLQKVRASGKDRFTACCPAHEDRSPSLMVSEKADKISIHCFAGCGAADILAAIGLDFDVLYPDRDNAEKGLRPWQRSELEQQLKHARMIIKIYENDVSKGVAIDLDNKKIALDAFKRVKILQKRLKNNE
jgi:CHC2 zinc finger